MMQSKIRACPSFLGTAAGLLSSKFIPDQPRAQSAIVKTASMTSDIIKEVAVFVGPLLVSSNALIGANFGGSIVGYAQALGAAAYYRYRTRQIDKQIGIKS